MESNTGMKVDENDINRNALKLISELTECIYEGKCNEEDYGCLAMTIGEIAGICELAEVLNEVLRS